MSMGVSRTSGRYRSVIRTGLHVRAVVHADADLRHDQRLRAGVRGGEGGAEHAAFGVGADEHPAAVRCGRRVRVVSAEGGGFHDVVRQTGGRVPQRPGCRGSPGRRRRAACR